MNNVHAHVHKCKGPSPLKRTKDQFTTHLSTHYRSVESPTGQIHKEGNIQDLMPNAVYKTVIYILFSDPLIRSFTPQPAVGDSTSK